MSTPPSVPSHITTPKKKGVESRGINTVISAVAAMAILLSSCEKSNSPEKIDSWDSTSSGEFVENTNATNLGDIDTTGKAEKFLRGMLEAVETPRVLGGPGAVQAFDNLSNLIKIKLRDPAFGDWNDDMVNFKIDYTDHDYIKYAVSAVKKDGLERIYITYSGNILDSDGKLVYENLEFMKSPDNSTIYLLDPD